MLQLFQSIFGSSRDEPSSHPAELVTRAIERAVDGTDPRLRAVSGYQKKLRRAVMHAIDHVVALVDGLPAVLDLNPQSYGTDREITAYFASVEHLREVLERDPMLNLWRRSSDGANAAEVVMLLLMTVQERKRLGVALEGDALRHDVEQTTVSFSRHQLLDPTVTEDETRRLLKRRAFDHLLTLALGCLSTAATDRGELEHQRELLRRKRAALVAGQWGFESADGNKPSDPRAVYLELLDIESQLSALGTGASRLEAHLAIVVDVLIHAETNFWSATRSLAVDRMGVKQTQAAALAPELTLTVLQNSAGQELVARVVRARREALPALRDLLREAERYLG